MIGIVIVAHGGLADTLLQAVEHVVGPLEQICAIGLEPRDDLAARRTEIEEASQQVNSGAGVVIVTDLFGGTPANLAIAAMAAGDIDVISGANLPLLMKLATSRTLPRSEAVAAAVMAGRKYILDAASVMGGAN
jgi:PTS system mannose-specific IIA component